MPLTIELMTLAATNIDDMVKFYNAVFDANLEGEDTPMGMKIYNGVLAGIPLQVCPNSLAQVDAKQNRQQFQFTVDDIEASVQAALANGGTELEPIRTAGDFKIASVLDPDGNSIVFKG